MARFGNLPVDLPQGIEVKTEEGLVTIKGPKGTLSRRLPKRIEIKKAENFLKIEREGESKASKALQGTTRAHIINMVKGVSEGWTKALELEGAGYRAQVEGKKLVLSLGFSHPVIFEAPEGISFAVEKATITITGIDKEVVNQLAAKIREVRPPDIYKGKGVRYSGEVIKLKPGKAAGKAEGGA